MKVLYYSSSGAIPSTFLLGQRIIQWLDTSKATCEKVDVFSNRKAREEVENLHGKVQIPCLIWEDRLFTRKQIEQALDNDSVDALLLGARSTNVSIRLNSTRNEATKTGKTRFIQEEPLRLNNSSDARDISVGSQQERFLNGVRRRLYVAKYLMEDASAHIKPTMVSVKYPNHSSYLKRYIRLKQHLLCIFETENTFDATPDEMIPLSSFFLKRHKSTLIKVTANNCSFDISFQSKDICNAWWNILLRTKRYLHLQEEEARMVNQLNDTFEKFAINMNREQAACRIQATWRAFQSRKMVSQIRQSLQASELGEQKCLDGILESLDMIGSGKIGTEVRIRGWIQWEKSNIQVQWYRKLPLSSNDNIEPIPTAVHNQRVVTADDLGQQLLAKVSWKPSIACESDCLESKSIFLELASPVVLPENMREILEQSIIQEIGEYRVDVMIIGDFESDMHISHRPSQQQRYLFKVTSERITIHNKYRFGKAIGKFSLSQLKWVRIDQEAKSIKDETSKCFLIAFKNNKVFHISAKNNMEREELVMTIRAFRAIHIIGSRLNSFVSYDSSLKKFQLFKFHGMKQLFKKSKNDEPLEITTVPAPQQKVEAVPIQMEDLNATCMDHSATSPETVQPSQESNDTKDAMNTTLLSNERTNVLPSVSYKESNRQKKNTLSHLVESNSSLTGRKQAIGDDGTQGIPSENTTLSLELEMSNVESMKNVTTRRIHWHKIPINRLKDSIWQETQATVWKIDESEIKAIFQLQPEQANFSVQQASGTIGENTQRVSLINERYARNLEILMGRFRNLAGEKVKKLILNGDCSSVTQMDEFLPLLSSLLPSLDDQQQLLDKAKNLDVTAISPPERFLLHLCEVPRCSQKVQSILFKLSFKETSDKVLHDLETLIQGAKEICQSNSLKEILSLSLYIGNVLNAQHPQGNARGYSIEDINIFSEVRSTKFSRVTLLNYMVSIFKRNMPQVLSFSEELLSLRWCAHLDSDSLLAQFEGLEHDMQQMHTEICQSLGDTCSMPFGEMMRPWYEEAQRTMEHLRTKIHTWHEHMEDVILYLPSVDTAACYNSAFQHLFRFVTDFHRAWNETEELHVLQMTGTQFERITIQAQQVQEWSEVNIVSDRLETNPIGTTTSSSSLPPPPPPPPPPSLSSHLPTIPSTCN
ncbi:hypothetical protein GpartN1_g6363.t1 [Galdieria partita]|uniref:FH2 domain-containing protein n=1 Tax=Galdieria partita TaxID=83374 RepID=A0A9C7UTD5_9RHOD|nr:hypothetical protein GpartN1_g6363.t1 [Galdieria partita]